MTYIIPIVILAACGLIAGILLTLASDFFYVKTDERVQKINDTLPQANCGACGFAGCADYADAIINSGAATNLCHPGGEKTSLKIAEILGVSAADVVPMTAVVHCNGNCDSTKAQFDFGGIQSCEAVKRFYSGNGACKFGCIGLGDCASICEHNAITIKNGLAAVSPSLCRGCGLCVAKCPNGIISIKPKSSVTAVLCSSEDNGRSTRLVCSKGCIGCKICEKKCPNGAISVVNSHAVIDYEKCTSCGICIAACPAKVINEV